MNKILIIFLLLFLFSCAPNNKSALFGIWKSNKEYYYKAIDIALGRAIRGQIAEELYHFGKEKYDINIINYTYDAVVDRRRLGIILKYDTEYDSMHRSRFREDSTKTAAISRKFNQVIEYQPSIPKFEEGNDFVFYYSLQNEAITDANWKVEKKYKKSIIKHFSEIWEILPIFRSTTVFYLKDADIEKYSKSGLSQQIYEAYFNKLKKFDLLNYLKTEKDFILKFDSKENLDKNYKGNLFDYSR